MAELNTDLSAQDFSLDLVGPRRTDKTDPNAEPRVGDLGELRWPEALGQLDFREYDGARNFMRFRRPPFLIFLKSLYSHGAAGFGADGSWRTIVEVIQVEKA